VAVCRTCGQENPEIARFCLACAAPFPAHAPPSHDTRKTITVVFADVVGSTALGEQLDAESVRRVIDRYFRELKAVLERHGGTVEKFVGDAVMAAFGIPVVHEDDALRAVRAAVEMRAAVMSLNGELEREQGVRIRMRIGVNTGEVVAGSGDLTFATGDAVNVAARLEQAAGPDEILIGESTYQLVRHAVAAEEVEPLTLKGKGKRIAAARLLAVSDAARGRPELPLVGRDRELALLGEAFERVVSERSCHLLTVIGSAGIGKSRLVREFLAHGCDEATVVRGRCLSYGEGITFWPIHGVVSEAAGLTGDESLGAAREKIRAVVAAARDADLIAERVAEAIGVGESVPGQRGTAWAFGRFVHELARRRPLVVVLDDIQWGAPTFLDLVEGVAAEPGEAPMLLLCMARPDLIELRPDWGSRSHGATRLTLAPLGTEASARLIANLLGSPGLDRSVRGPISAVAEGNPLFVEEVVAMLVDDGVLQSRNGSASATSDLSTISLPPTIQAVLRARLERLDESERSLLERGSVEGKVFHRGAVFELSAPDERSQAGERLRRLQRRDFLQPARAAFPDEQAFRFRHQLLRDVAYESLPKSVRADLHERLAGWLEARAAGRAQEFDEILGHHLEQAYDYRSHLGAVGEHGRELAVRAASHLGSAGSRAYARGDMSGSGNLLARALKLLPAEDVARSDYMRKLDDARFELGEHNMRRLSRTSLRCFWQRPVGHSWEMKESRGSRS
jgi:class 3 adenylate cyclase